MSDAPGVEDGSGAFSLPAPLSFTGVAKHAWKLYRSNFGALLRLYLVAALALFLVALGFTVIYVYTTLSIQIRSFMEMVNITSYALTGTFATAVASAFLVDRIAERDVSIGETWRSIRPFGRDLLTAGFLVAVLALTLVLILVGLGFFLMPIVFGPPVIGQVIAVERKRLQDAWPRGRELGQREWGRIIMYLITMGLLVALFVNLVAYGVGYSVAGVATGSAAIETIAGVIFGLALPHLLFAIGWPLIAAAQTVIYLDLRARKEDLTHPKLVAERAKLGPANRDPDPNPD